MILVDTSVWIDHLREERSLLAGLLIGENVVLHPFVLGELALGTLTELSGKNPSIADKPEFSTDQVVDSIMLPKIWTVR